jgi:hypothetical protein
MVEAPARSDGVVVAPLGAGVVVGTVPTGPGTTASCGDDVVVVGAVVVEVDEVATFPPVSGLAHAEGAVEPVWPGMRTVPAQPKLLKSAWTLTEPPSENW